MLDFLVQFYVDDARTPIEDTSVPWKPGDTPLVKVAQVRIPRCDLDDPGAAALSQAVDRLSFSPWHTTEDHRPLGNVMRGVAKKCQVKRIFRQHRIVVARDDGHDVAQPLLIGSFPQIT